MRRARGTAALLRMIDASEIRGRDGSRRIAYAHAANVLGQSELDYIVEVGNVKLTYTGPVVYVERNQEG